MNFLDFKMNFDFKKVPKISTIIEKLFERKILSEHDLFTKSLIYEPRKKY